MKRSRFRKRLPLLLSVAGFLTVATVYVFGLSSIQLTTHPLSGYGRLITLRFIEVVIFSWLLYVGGSIGSFLNVVAYRMPRGLTTGGRSKCPSCGNILRGRDNLPMVAWIALNGRCRSCALPISIRYPIVEACVAFTIAFIGMFQLYSMSLPDENARSFWRPLWTPRFSTEMLITLTYHTAVYACLWAMVLIRMDGSKIPRKLIAWATVTSVVPMLVHQPLMVVPWQLPRPEEWSPVGGYFDSLMRVITALVTAALVGRALAKGLCPTADLKLDPLGSGTKKLVDLITMLMLPTLLIGWQSISAVVLIAACLVPITRRLLNVIPPNALGKAAAVSEVEDDPNGRGVYEHYVFALPFATAIHLVFWLQLWNLPFWPSDQAGPYVIVVAAILVLFVPVFLKQRTTVGQIATVEEDSGAFDESADDLDELPDEE
ncbi:MAG: prepilin peptidase [Planctomycetota bacterium]